MTLNVRPEVEAHLHALARAQGVSVEALTEQVVTEIAGPGETNRLSFDEWNQQFEQWADSAPPVVVDPR